MENGKNVSVYEINKDLIIKKYVEKMKDHTFCREDINKYLREQTELYIEMNLKPFLKSLTHYDLEELITERNKICSNLKAKYIDYEKYINGEKKMIVDKDIAEDNHEKNRFILRKRISFLIMLINSYINSNKNADFMGFWQDTNNAFNLSSWKITHNPILRNRKDVTFADTLSLNGLRAYKNFLSLFCCNLSKTENKYNSRIDALSEELGEDLKFTKRDDFSSNLILRKNDELYDNLLKELFLNEIIKKSENTLKK